MDIQHGVVLDYETTIRCPVGNNKANPMWHGNKIIAAGAMDLFESTPLNINYSETGLTGGMVTPVDEDVESFYVGHNIKFDLLYLYRSHPTKKLPYIWCTQLAEYILTAQQSRYASLNELISKYVGNHALKDDKIKKYWDDGVDTNKIPRNELVEYLKNDVIQTKEVFLQQWKLAEEKGQLPLILAMMDALRATTAMNLHGMAVDWKYVENAVVVYRNLAEYSKKMVELSSSGTLKGSDAASPKKVSNYFFGGKEKYKESELVGKYKNGKDKFKMVEKTRVLTGLYDPKAYKLNPNKLGYYQVDDTILSKLADDGDATAKHILDYRRNSKIAETYYGGLLNARMGGQYIYPQINHTATATGRLSCTSPNLQNQTDIGDIKRSFVSRFGEKGYILELDYSQLEVVWLAYLSNDAQLIDDINNDRDIHTELYKDMYRRVPTKAERKAFKPRTFQLIYGAGYKAIAEQGNIAPSEAKVFIDVFYSRYPGVKRWHESLLREAKDNRVLYYTTEHPGPHYYYEKTMPWKRQYYFEAYENDWSAERTFSPTELKNYPVQGSATGDMVPMMLGVVQRELENMVEYQMNEALLVMTVHDSLVFDVHEDHLVKVARKMKSVLERAPDYLKTMFNIDFPCKLSVGVEAGRTWNDKEELVV